jgi:hypothetical protein
MLTLAETVVVNAIRVDRSIVACSKIARYLRDAHGLEVVDRADAPIFQEPKRTVILINSPWGFCSDEHRGRVGMLIERAKRVVWAQNDYNSGIGPRSFRELTQRWFNKGRAIDLWTTIPEYVERGSITPAIPLTDRSAYVNWNALHYEPRRGRAVPPIDARTPKLFYYGPWRPDRVERFERYLPGLGRSLVVSTSKRCVPKFAALAPKADVVDLETDLLGTMATYAAALLIEDRASERKFCSLPARFYEALSVGTALLVDAASVENLERARVPVFNECVVRSARDVLRILKAPDRIAYIANQQLRTWCRNYHAELKLQLEGAFRL